MSFGNRADKCKTIRNYSQALMFFTRYPKPRSSKWSDNERPIYIDGGKPSTRMHQYRMAAGPTDTTTSTPAYFDLVLHSTSVIRYMAPTEDNKRVVYLTYGGWTSTLTRAFMWQHGWHYGQEFNTTDGTRVAVPLNYCAKSERWVDNQWLAKLTFNEDDKLIVPESDHMIVYKRKSSTEDKSVRADMRRKMDLMHDMLWFSVESLLTDLKAAVDGQSTSKWRFLQDEFGPFTSALDRLSPDNYHRIREAKPEFLQDDVSFTPDTIEAMRALYMCVFRHLYGKNLADGTKTLPTQDDCRKSVTNYLMTINNIKDGTRYEPLPKFMLVEDYPARAHFLRPR